MREDDTLITVRHAQKLKKRKFHNAPPTPSRSSNVLRPLPNPAQAFSNNDAVQATALLRTANTTAAARLKSRKTDAQEPVNKPNRGKNALIQLLSDYNLQEDIITWLEFLRAHFVENRPDADYRFGLRMHFSRSWNVIIREKWGWMPVQSEFKIYRAENDKHKNYLLGYARIDNTWEYNKLADALQIWESTTNQLLKYTVPLLFYHCEDDEETDYWRTFIITPYYSRKLLPQLGVWKRRGELDFKRIVNVLLDISMAVAEYHLKENAAQLVMLNYIRPDSFVYDEADDTFLLFDLTPAVAVSKYLRSLGKTELHMQHLRSKQGFRYVAPELHGYTSHLGGDVDPLKLDDWQVGVAFWEILCACYADNSGIKQTSDKVERRLLNENGFCTRNFSYFRPHPFLMALVQLLTAPRPRERLEIWQVIDLLCLMCDREHPFGPYPYEPVTMQLLSAQLKHEASEIGSNSEDEQIRNADDVSVNQCYADDVNFIFQSLQWSKSEAFARYVRKKFVSGSVSDAKPFRARIIIMENGEKYHLLPRRVQNTYGLLAATPHRSEIEQLSMNANYTPSIESDFLQLDTLAIHDEDITQEVQSNKNFLPQSAAAVTSELRHGGESEDEISRRRTSLERMSGVESSEPVSVERSMPPKRRRRGLSSFYCRVRAQQRRRPASRQPKSNDIDLKPLEPQPHVVEWTGTIAVKTNMFNGDVQNRKCSFSTCRGRLYSTGMLRLRRLDDKQPQIFKIVSPKRCEKMKNKTVLTFNLTRPCVRVHDHQTGPAGFYTGAMFKHSWLRKQCLRLLHRHPRKTRRTTNPYWQNRTDVTVEIEFETLASTECFNYLIDPDEEAGNTANAGTQQRMCVYIPETLTKHYEWLWFRFDSGDDKTKFFTVYKRLKPGEVENFGNNEEVVELLL